MEAFLEDIRLAGTPVAGLEDAGAALEVVEDQFTAAAVR